MRSRQGGWIGLVVMLVGLVIVAFLAKEALKQYGVLPGKPPIAEKAATPGERARAAGAMGVDALDLDSSAPQTCCNVRRTSARNGWTASSRRVTRGSVRFRGRANHRLAHNRARRGL